MKQADPQETLAALNTVRAWAADPEGVAKPSRAQVATAVRLSARYVAQKAPGHSVELRIPPYVAVQCIEGPRHTRGTPPNVVEADPLIWLQVVLGLTTFDAAVAKGSVQSSGSRAGDLAHYVPILEFQQENVLN